MHLTPYKVHKETFYRTSIVLASYTPEMIEHIQNIFEEELLLSYTPVDGLTNRYMLSFYESVLSFVQCHNQCWTFNWSYNEALIQRLLLFI
jgi:hypothetical protein